MKFILNLIFIQLQQRVIYLQFSDNIYATVFGFFSTGIILLLGQICCYICQCYEFNDINQYKRKISLLSVLLVLKAILIVITNYEPEVIKIPCILLVLIFCITSIYDSLVNRPFQSVYLTKIYITNSFFFFSATMVQSALMLEILDESNILFMVIGLCPLAANLGLCLYEDILMNLIQNIDIQEFWVYSQQLIAMYSDQTQKFIIYVSLRHQINNCKDPNCYCVKYGKNLKLDNKSQSIVNGNKDNDINYRCLRELNLKFDDVVKILDSMFYRTLNDEKLERKDRLNYLYVSFLEKYSGNKLMSYYYLKYQLLSSSNQSLFYKLIYSIVLKVFILINQKLESKLIYFNKVQLSQANIENTVGCLEIEQIVQLEQSCDVYQQCFQTILNEKATIWQLIEKGSETISQFIRKVLPSLNIIVRQFQQLQQELNKLNQDYENAGFLKIISLRNLIVYNSFGKVMMLEQKIQELKNKDQYRDDNELNNYNLMSAQNTFIRVGLTKKFGQILNKNNEKVKAFFGFNDEEVNKISNITSFMPQHIAAVHNYIIFSYLQDGSNALLYKNRKVYLVNKNQFLFPVSLTIRNDFFDMEDCVFNVNLLKVSYSDIIMFNSHGQILGISEKIFILVSNQSELFTQDQLLQYGLIQILMPNFFKIINEIQSQPQQEYLGNSNQTFENLQCSVFTNSNVIRFSQQYITKLEETSSKFSRLSTSNKRIGLFDHKELGQMAEFFKDEKEFKNNSIKFHLRFNLHQYNKDFRNVSKGFIDIIGQKFNQEDNLTYFVIDIKEMENLNKKNLNLQTISSVSQCQTFTPNQTLTHKPTISAELQGSHEKSDEYPNGSEDKGQLEFHLSEYKLALSPKFSVESPRIQIETPKDTELMMIQQSPGQKIAFVERKNIFYKKLFQSIEKKDSKLSETNHPKYISKNDIQDEGIREFEEDAEIDIREQQKNIENNNRKHCEQDKMVYYITKIKQEKQKKKILDEQQSTTSGMSKTERENIEQVYQNTKMPKQFYRYIMVQIILILIPLSSVIAQSIVLIQKLENIIVVSNHLLIPYELNRVYINSAQQYIYLHSEEFQKANNKNFANSANIFHESINQTILQFRLFLNEEIDQYIQVVETDIVGRFYYEESSYTNETLFMYDYLVSTYQEVRDSDQLNTFYDLISRFYAITETTDVINDYQVLNIANGIDNLISTISFITFLSIGLLILPFFPYLIYIHFLNIFQEKIILLITRVNFDEYLRELKRLENISLQIKNLRGLNLVTTEFVTEFIYEFNVAKSKQPAKQNVLQSKIYDVKLPLWFEGSALIFITSCFIALLIGGLMFSNQIPNIYMPRTGEFVHLSHEYQHIQHYNLLNELLVNNLYRGNLSLVNDLYDEALASYTVFPLPFPQEDGNLNYLNDIYFSNLCNNSTFIGCKNGNYSKSYENGLNGVIQQIKLLFYREQFKRQKSDEYWALVVFFPSFIEPFLYQILAAKNDNLSVYIQSLETGCLLYLLAGGISLLLFCSIYFYKQSESLYRRIYLLRHLLMFIPYEKFNEQITVSLLKQIKEF